MVFLKNYSWGAVEYSTPAETVGAVLESIENRDGAVTKESFLEESRPESAPTHGMFEWDDEKAAEKYRLHQSGQIIRNLVVHIQKAEDEEPKKVRAMVSISNGKNEKGTYISSVQAMQVPFTRETVLKHAMQELQQFRNKYKDLEEFAALFKEIAKLEVA